MRRGTHCAPAALRSDNHGESVHAAGVSCGTPATPQAPRHRRSHRGLKHPQTSIRAIAALGLDGTGAARHVPCAVCRVPCAVWRLAFGVWRLARGCLAERSNGPSGCSAVLAPTTPSGRAEKRSAGRIRAARCLSRRRVCAAPARREHRRLPRCAAAGSRTAGSPFLCLLSFGEAKESEAPAGASPGSHTQQGARRRTHQSPRCWATKSASLSPRPERLTRMVCSGAMVLATFMA